jgi:hypothetical protein
MKDGVSINEAHMRTKKYQLVGIPFKHRYVPPSKAKKLILNKDLIMNVYDTPHS